MMEELRFKASYFFGIKFPISKDDFYNVRKKFIFKYHSDKSSNGKSDPDALNEVLEISKQVLDNLDELNNCNVVYFSKEQIDYLIKLMTPECCHILGHKHYLNSKDFCSEQKAKAYDNLRNTIGLKINTAKSKYNCPYCKDIHSDNDPNVKEY